jgi:hypothetical protein
MLKSFHAALQFAAFDYVQAARLQKQEVQHMKLRHNIARVAVVALMTLTFASAANAVSPKTRNTVIGAGLGGLAGAVLTEGDPLVTLGGAAAGGLLGNIMTEDRRDRSYGHRRHYDDRRHYNHRKVNYYKKLSRRHHHHRR